MAAKAKSVKTKGKAPSGRIIFPQRHRGLFYNSDDKIFRKRKSVAKDSSGLKPAKGHFYAADAVSETFGVRGAGAGTGATFGDEINNDDLLFAVKREPAAYRAIFQVAHDVFAKWFKIVDKSQEPNEDFDALVQKVLDALNARNVFTRAAVFERLFGWSIIVLGFVDYGKGLSSPVEGMQEIRDLFPYSLLSVDVQSSDEEKDPKSPRFGLPVSYTFKQSGVEQVKIHYSRVIHLATRLLDHPYKGLSILQAMYDDLTVFRNIRWGMGQTLFRYGSGFPDIEFEGATKKQLDDLENSQQFKSLQARTYFLHSDKVKFEFKGVAGKALNPEPYVDSCIEQLSIATAIPKAIMRGAQAGALAGSDVNEREYFKFISDLQALYEPAIWQLIDLLMESGQIPKVEDYEIKWNGGFELNELDKTAATLNVARTEQVYSSWLTVNELRARMNPPLDPLPDDEGNVIPGLQKPQQPFSQSTSSEEKQDGKQEDRNKQG
jgi:hypothetical protein